MKKTIFFSLLAISTGLILTSCDKVNKEVPVQFLLTDNPTNYDQVNIHIVEMRVKVNDDSLSWIDIPTKDTVVNLLTLQNGVNTVIAQGNIPAGTLKEVRFILGDGNNVVVNGTTYPIATPSAEESGLKIKIDKKLQSSLNTLVIDFDAAASIKEENGSYKLKPVIKLKP
jgi:hypothetical protein